MTTPVTIISESDLLHPVFSETLVGTASMCSMTFLQVDRCSNEPFSTYCVYCVFYKLILRILRILQIVILEYCVYCVFYKLTSAHIAYIAYIALRILRNIALRCVFYNKPCHSSSNILQWISGKLCLGFPSTSTINQFFTPSLFTAYHREGYRACVESGAEEFLTDSTVVINLGD